MDLGPLSKAIRRQNPAKEQANNEHIPMRTFFLYLNARAVTIQPAISARKQPLLLVCRRRNRKRAVAGSMRMILAGRGGVTLPPAMHSRLMAMGNTRSR